MTAPVIEIKNLNVEFSTSQGSIHALQDVSLSVKPGTITGIVGESGSGKSTVVWSISRLLSNNADITSGEILFKGEDVLAYSQSQLEDYRGKEVAIVFQDPMTSQNPVLRYSRQMTDIQYRSTERYSDKLRRAVASMSRVGIPDPEQRIKSYPHQFSGGMRQRAGIAMAISMNPSLLICDEATTALDVTMEAQIIHLIKELKRELEGSVVFVSHNLGLIAEMCDEVVVMYAGRVIEKGSVHDIFHHPRHPYTQALLACDPARIEGRSRQLPTIPGDVPRLNKRQHGCGFAPRCSARTDQCDAQVPPQTKITEDHVVHCHLYSDTRLEKFQILSPSVQPAPPADDTTAKNTKQNTPLDNKPLLDVSGLAVQYRSGDSLLNLFRPRSSSTVDAVIDTSLHIKRGETLGLVGESGSGKTSLGRAALKLLKESSGQIHFDNQNISDFSQTQMKPLRSEMALMFQDPVGSLSPRKTVYATLKEPFQIAGVAADQASERVDELFDLVGLPRDFAGRYPHELSGGQARRVGVARALALNPKLIIADEPTAGLDVSVQGEILNLMANLQCEHGLSYLIISHNLPVVRHVCDRVAIMYMGRIVEQGRCEEVFHSPLHPYTQALVNSIPQPDPDKRRDLVSIEGEVPSLTHRPTGCEFHPRCLHRQDKCSSEIPERTTHHSREVICHFPLSSAAKTAPTTARSTH